jgi:hypothetical protein
MHPFRNVIRSSTHYKFDKDASVTKRVLQDELVGDMRRDVQLTVDEGVERAMLRKCVPGGWVCLPGTACCLKIASAEWDANPEIIA